MGKTVAVLQSNYIPWKGYFDIIHDVDLFVFYDDVQFTKNDWRNRNLIKTPDGPKWLTIPVGKRIDRLICEVQIQDSEWQGRHWNLLKQHYADTPHFWRYEAFLKDVYLGRVWQTLSELNHFLIVSISRELGISTEFADSRSLQPAGTRTDRLLDVLKKVGTDVYVSGPAARSYLPEPVFEDAGIQVIWKSYAGYPEYAQPYPPFSHQVTVLDLLFSMGPDAPDYIWGWRAQQSFLRTVGGPPSEAA